MNRLVNVMRRGPGPQSEELPSSSPGRTRTQVVGVWFGVEAAYRKSLIAKNESALGGALKAKEPRLAVAAAVNSAE